MTTISKPAYGKWKFDLGRREILIVSCPDGKFVLDHPWGVPTVILPERRRWPQVAPDWAKNDWDELYFYLHNWCVATGSDLHIGGYTDVSGNLCDAQVWPARDG
jgi:hypothetical protein